ncbi:methyltransferase family protein [Motilibacter rhizosphaerae]|uniref:Methyltransferase family protein n=1 Tax=Motilibacter rhizosphaerae TaxID=598652 RepID=A0A4V2F4G8_9ACTN|nr:methyltransferase domain-containing protein [Motilibacter rhizosphaerae]RZS87557.1 methyltransferase family protein [Motilibacter rhizosphaerae]
MPTLLPDYLVTARSLREYAAMLGLDPAALAGRDVLDCPGGAASFAAEAAALGARVTAADPVYALPAGEVAVRALDDTAAGARGIAAHAERYAWTTFAGPEEHAAERTAAAARFAWDLRVSPERYVAAALPDLPFSDGSFDLVLSSHLLFTYADRLDPAFHVAAARELVRVCRPGGEVRVFPLVPHDPAAYAPVAEVRAALEADGCVTAVLPVAYRLQRGAYSALVITPPPR